METKKINLHSVLKALILIIYGITIIINNSTRGGLSKTIGNWYELIFIMLSVWCIVDWAIKKAPQYSLPMTVFLFFYLYLRLSRAEAISYSYIDLIFLLPMGVGIGLIVSYILTKGRSGYLKTGLGISLFAGIFLIASVKEIFGYVLPSLIIGIGIIWLINAISAKKITFFLADNEKAGYNKNANRTYSEYVKSQGDTPKNDDDILLENEIKDDE